MGLPAYWLLQAPPLLDEGAVRFLELLGAGLLGFVTAVTVFRATLKSIRGDVDGNTKALDEHKKSSQQSLDDMEGRLVGKIAELHNLITQRENSEVVETLRAEGRLASEFSALRKENHERHIENRRDLRVQRRQQYAILEILVDGMPARGRKQVEAAMKMLRVEMETDGEGIAA